MLPLLSKLRAGRLRRVTALQASDNLVLVLVLSEAVLVIAIDPDFEHEHDASSSAAICAIGGLRREGKGCDKAQRSGARRCVVAEHEHAVLSGCASGMGWGPCHFLNTRARCTMASQNVRDGAAFRSFASLSLRNDEITARGRLPGWLAGHRLRNLAVLRLGNDVWGGV